MKTTNLTQTKLTLFFLSFFFHWFKTNVGSNSSVVGQDWKLKRNGLYGKDVCIVIFVENLLSDQLYFFKIVFGICSIKLFIFIAQYLKIPL